MSLLDTQHIKEENTKYLVELYNGNKISFGDCINKINIIGDLNLLNRSKLDNGKIEFVND